MREGWSKRKIEEIATITMGQSPSGNSINEINGMEFHQGKIYFGEKYIKESHFYTSDPIRFAEPNSLLLCVRAPIGVVNITDRKICIGRGLCSIKANDSVQYNYLYYAILSQKEYYKKNATGSTFQAISSNVVKETPIPVPSKEKQRQIASELDKITEMISKYDEQLKELDKLSQSIFYEMFGDPVENEKGWEVKKIEEIADATIGLTYKPENVADNGVIVLRSGNIQNSTLDFTDILRVETNIPSHKYVKDGDILMCTRNGSLRHVGKVAIIKNLNEQMTYGAFMTVIRSEMNPYLYGYFNTPAFRDSLIHGKTTTINQITVKMLNETSLPIPPLPLQQSFARKIEAIEAMKSKVREAKKEAETLLAARMQYWFE